MSLPAAWPSLSANWTSASSNPTQDAMALIRKAFAPFGAKLPQPLNPQDQAKLQEAIAQAAFDRTRSFLDGIRAYQKHGTQRKPEKTGDPVEIWRSGTTSLLDYAPDDKDAPLLFVVPSLINRFDILDLAPDHSFLRFLAQQGFRPVVVDWDAPGEDEKDFTVSDYVTKRLIPALDRLMREADGKPCIILGYCMGGLLALALALLKPESLHTLVLMATPWDMTQGSPEGPAALAQAMLSLTEQLDPWLSQLGYLPVAILQAMFNSVQPSHALKKFIRFANLDPESLEARLFVLTEDWLNDGVPLTAPVARECLHDWYGENRPGKGVWEIAGKIVDPGEIKVPTYVIVPGLDKIVAPESARPLAALIPNAFLAEPMMGHIGLLSSRHATERVWNPLVAWLRSQQAARA
jgi:polyhydroxyalkanoate synthase